MRVVDLFCGCGGMSLGFQKAGFEISVAFDHWEAAITTYNANFPNHIVLKQDLSHVDATTNLLAQFTPDIIIGGPPCQDFSSAGKRDESLGRADLTQAFAQIVETVRPEWFVMENVDRIVTSKIYTNAKETLALAGYGLTQVVLNAAFCGVPQSRKRLFLIGQQGGKNDALANLITSQLSKRPMTVRDYLGNNLDIEHYYRHPRSYLRRGVFSIDEPSPTIRGINRPIPPNYQTHAGDTAPVTDKLRPLSTKERSLIQTFPTDFIFPSKKADAEQLIGNAVPVKLAEFVANCIQQILVAPPIVIPIGLLSLFQMQIALPS